MDRDGARMSIVIGLLIGTLVITGWMAVRAQYAARAHRAQSENVILDWTRVAADELARRGEAQVTYYGTYPVLLTLANTAQLPTAAEIKAAAKTPVERRNARLAGETFRYERGATFANTALRRILDLILENPPSPGEREPIWAGNRVYVYTLSTDGRRISGFEVNRAEVGPFLEMAMSMRPLLPTSLAKGHIGNDAIEARATDSRGRVLFETARPLDDQLKASHRPQDGVLRGINVETSLARSGAHDIVGTGIDRGPPTFLLLMLIAGVLLLAAILQIGRERALARLRSDFVAGVSHELRTPLTQIRMFVETLQLDRVRSDEERQRALAIIDQESRRLGQLVENVLQFSRGERGVLRIDRQTADVGAIVKEAVSAFLPLAEAERMQIETSVDANSTASVDEDAFRQVVLNLLDNAVKYGPSGQKIVVEVRRHDVGVLISVDDEGPGIPPRHRQDIWRRYVRLERGDRAVAGAGIGLAVAHEIVTLHEGKAWCESGTRGGARFVVQLKRETS